MGLSRLHGRRLAVVLLIDGQHRVLCGTGCYLSHDRGGLLEVELDNVKDSGSPRFILDESQWDHEITGGHEYDCDFCLRIAMAEE